MMLEAKNISFSYSNKHILKDITFSVKKGELLGIIGPNGSGKTTLIKNITGILKTGGDVFLSDRENLKNLKRKDIAKRIGVVPQKSKLKGNFTVQEVVEMGRYVYHSRFSKIKKKDKDIVYKIMDELNLVQFAQRKICELSGGEFQKVLVARALAQEPEILIFDEATSNLDINHSIEIFKLAKELIKDKKITVIAIIHDLNLATQFCDRIMILKNGEKYTIGSPKEVITSDILEKTFSLQAEILENPLNQKPYIIPII